MQKNKYITEVSKNFRHKIPITKELDKIDYYEMADFKCSANLIGNARLIVITGNYTLSWKPLYKSEAEVNKKSRSFMEIINIEDLKLRYKNIKIESTLRSDPRLLQFDNLKQQFILVGEISCKLYIGKEKKEGFVKIDTVMDKKYLPNIEEKIEKGDCKVNNIGEIAVSELSSVKDDIDDLNKIKNSEENKGDILCIASTRWNFIWQRPHHLMYRLSKKGYRVLFFNHSMAESYEEIQKLLLSPKLLNEKLKRISSNLWVFSSFHLSKGQNKILPDIYTPQSYNNMVKEESLKYLINKLKIDNPIVITYLAESINYIKKIPRSLLCYDCVDDFSGFSWAEENIDMYEKDLLGKSDFVITSAEELYKRIKDVNKDTYLLPNAVEFEHFASNNYSLNKNKIHTKKPVIGFVGAFFEWIDEQLLEYLIKKRKGWEFQFIGPVQSGMGYRLNNQKNAIFFGARDYKELPKFLSRIDVCIIPFKLNKVTMSANPIKLWEYMATGKPIVSTSIPEVKKFADIVYIADSKENFLLKIEEALLERTSERSSRRVAIAKENDWNDRVEKLLEIIKEFSK